MSAMQITRCVFVLAASAIVAVAPALAQPVADRAAITALRKQQAVRRLTQAGQEALAAGRYDEAIAKFEQAYSVIRHPALLFNLGQAYQVAGKLPEAAAAYRRFLSRTPEGDEAGLARNWLAEIEASLLPPVPEVLADPPPARLPAAAEPVVGTPDLLTVSVTREAELSSRARNGGILMALGGALAVGGIGYAVIDTDGTREHHQIATVVALGGGLPMFIGGAVMLHRASGERRRMQGQLAIVPTVSPSSVGLAVSGPLRW